jgi:hypothetical protein
MKAKTSYFTENKNVPFGFFTLSKSLAEVWDNKKDDEWDKFL